MLIVWSTFSVLLRLIIWHLTSDFWAFWRFGDSLPRGFGVWERRVGGKVFPDEKIRRHWLVPCCIVYSGRRRCWALLNFDHVEFLISVAALTSVLPRRVIHTFFDYPLTSRGAAD